MDLIFLGQTDSTNRHLQRLLDAGQAKEGTTVLSDMQTEGRGQRGKQWVSLPGQGIYASVLFTPASLAVGKQFQFNKAIACGVAAYIHSRTGLKAEIKWPNDILVEDKKVAGILIENNIRGSHVSSCIAGIGINLNQGNFEGEFETTPVSLLQLRGVRYDARQEMALLYPHLMSRYFQFCREGATVVSEQYNNLLYGRGRSGFYQNEAGLFSGTLLEVDEEGAAIIGKEGQITRHFHPLTRQVVNPQE